MIYEAFDYNSWEDFALHDPPSHTQLRAFRENEGSPDVNDLRLDMRGTMSSPWNKQVTDLLYLKVMASKGEDNENGGRAWEDLPEQSQGYFEDLIVSQLRRAKLAWGGAQPQEKEDGTLETQSEAEKRVTRVAEVKEASNRARTRRRQVRKTHNPSRS